MQAGRVEGVIDLLPPSQLGEHGIEWEDSLAFKLEEYARKHGDEVSEYAMTNGEEYFAEAFVRYTQGRGDEIFPELFDLFERILK